MEEEAAPSFEWTLEEGLEQIMAEEMADIAEATVVDHERRQVGVVADGSGLRIDSIDMPDGANDVEDEREAVLQAMFDMHPMFEEPDIVFLNAESTFASWSADSDAGFGVLRDRDAVIQDIGLVRTSQIALVHAVDDRVLFVHWQDELTARGMEVKLDDQERAIFSMSMRVTPASYADAILVHPAVGIRMQKLKGMLRPRMPAGILRLQRMWSAAAHVSEEPACLLCRKHGRAEAPVKLCVLCMGAMHLPCAALLHCKYTAAVAAKTRFTCELPSIMCGKLCILCESRVQYETVGGA